MKTYKQFISEMDGGAAPTNAVGGGAIAGVGVGSSGEPGVSPNKKKSALIAKLFTRKAQK